MRRIVLLWSAAWAALSLPLPAPAQTAADTALLALPGAAALTCETDSSPLLGLRAFLFSVGAPSLQIRDASGQLLAAGPAPREIAAVFDTAGRPALLSDVVRLGVTRQVSVTVHFDRDGNAVGFRQLADTDSAAVMARVQREGLRALDRAIQENTRMRPPEALDALALRRARMLIEWLWGKRCP